MSGLEKEKESKTITPGLLNLQKKLNSEISQPTELKRRATGATKVKVMF